MCRRAVMSLFLVFSLAVPLSGLRGAESGGSIAGVVRDASGKPVAGATALLFIPPMAITNCEFQRGRNPSIPVSLESPVTGGTGLNGPST